MTTRTGGCLCGAIRFTAIQAEGDEMGPPGLGACHCENCRRQSGGVYLSINLVPNGLAIEDETTLGVYQSSEWAERGFCTRCGSSLYWRMTMDGPAKGMTILAAGTLDDQSGLTLTHEVYVDKKPDGYNFAQKTHQMTEADVMAMVSANGS